MKAFGKAANAICCFLFGGANIQVSRRYFHLFHLPESRNPCSISSCKSIEPAQALCPQSKGQQHPSIRTSAASKLKDDPAHLPSPSETHAGYWAWCCALQCKRGCGQSRVSPVKGHKDGWDRTVLPEEKKDLGGPYLVCKYLIEKELKQKEPVQVLHGCSQQEDKTHCVQTEAQGFLPEHRKTPGHCHCTGRVWSLFPSLEILQAGRAGPWETHCSLSRGSLWWQSLEVPAILCESAILVCLSLGV